MADNTITFGELTGERGTEELYEQAAFRGVLWEGTATAESVADDGTFFVQLKAAAGMRLIVSEYTVAIVDPNTGAAKKGTIQLFNGTVLNTPSDISPSCHLVGGTIDFMSDLQSAAAAGTAGDALGSVRTLIGGARVDKAGACWVIEPGEDLTMKLINNSGAAVDIYVYITFTEVVA